MLEITKLIKKYGSTVFLALQFTVEEVGLIPFRFNVIAAMGLAVLLFGDAISARNRSAGEIDMLTGDFEMRLFYRRPVYFSTFLDMPWQKLQVKWENVSSWEETTDMLYTLETIADDAIALYSIKSKLLLGQELRASDKRAFFQMAEKYRLDRTVVQDILSKKRLTPRFRLYLMSRIRQITKHQVHLSDLYLKSLTLLVENETIMPNQRKERAFKRLRQILMCELEDSSSRADRCLNGI